MSFAEGVPASGPPGISALHHVQEAKMHLSAQLLPLDFMHLFATHLLECGQDIRMIQELLGHSDGRVNMIHAHVLN
jgi:site-specific recombinase XerD